MAKDLTRGPELTRSEQARTKLKEAQQTEVDAGKKALAKRMLFGAASRPQPAQGPARIILGLDCTSSMGEYLEERRITPEAASAMARGLFAKAGPEGLAVQLAFFRGDLRSPKQSRQFRVSSAITRSGTRAIKWYTTPEELARAITAIEHWPGWTQHCRLLRHAVAEAEMQAIAAVVILSDAFEQQTPLRPEGDDLVAARVQAGRLRELGVKIVVGYKGTIQGGCPLDRAGVGAERAFGDITRENGGYCFPLSEAELRDRFCQIAEHALLTAHGNTTAAQLLLEHLQAIPFEMTVAEPVPSTRCASESEGSDE